MDKPGLYHARYLEGKTTEASTGTPQLALKFEVTHIAVATPEGNSAWQELDEPMDRTIFLSLTNAAWPYAKKKLERNNFNGDFDNPQLVMPDGIELVCQEDTYQGRTRSRWDIPRGDAAEAKPAGQDKVRRLNALWKVEQAKATAPKATAPKLPTAPPTPKQSDASAESGQEADDKDVPF